MNLKIFNRLESEVRGYIRAFPTLFASDASEEIMEGSIPESYRIADFVAWDREKRLRLNPEFQRGPVWTPDPRSYLVETILRGFPMPKIYMRTAIDTS